MRLRVGGRRGQGGGLEVEVGPCDLVRSDRVVACDARVCSSLAGSWSPAGYENAHTSPCPTHVHTCTNTDRHTHTHTHTHRDSHSHTHVHTCRDTDIIKHTETCKLIPIHTHKQTHTHTINLSHTHSHSPLTCQRFPVSHYLFNFRGSLWGVLTEPSINTSSTDRRDPQPRALGPLSSDSSSGSPCYGPLRY